MLLLDDVDTPLAPLKGEIRSGDCEWRLGSLCGTRSQYIRRLRQPLDGSLPRQFTSNNTSAPKSPFEGGFRGMSEGMGDG